MTVLCYSSGRFHRGLALPGPEISSASRVRFGLFEADLGRGTLSRQGTRLKLQVQPFRILALLLQQPGEIVTREQCRQALWPEGTHVNFDGSLNAALKKLRAALQDEAENPSIHRNHTPARLSFPGSHSSS